jgi:uncharacterized membrane protein
MKKTNTIIGIISLLLSVTILITAQDMPGQSSMFPKYLAIIFGVLAVVLVGINIKNNEENQKKLEKFFVPLMAKGMSFILAYIILIEVIGFFVSTFIFTIGFMFMYKENSKKTMIVTALGINLFIYVLFVLQLNVPLPQGLLF